MIETFDFTFLPSAGLRSHLWRDGGLRFPLRSPPWQLKDFILVELQKSDQLMAHGLAMWLWLPLFPFGYQVSCFGKQSPPAPTPVICHGNGSHKPQSAQAGGRSPPWCPTRGFCVWEGKKTGSQQPGLCCWVCHRGNHSFQTSRILKLSLAETKPLLFPAGSGRQQIT